MSNYFAAEFASTRMKWEVTAKQNFFDPSFNDWLQIKKAVAAFSSSTDFTEDSYRAEAALLNASLTYLIDSTSSKFLDLKAVQKYLLSLDNLIAKSSTLERTESLDKVQYLVRAILYYRIGDYQMSCFRFVNKSKNGVDSSRNLIYALCAYGLALDHILDRNSVFGKSVRDVDQMQLVELLMILELYLVLSKNFLNNPSTFKRVSREMSNRELSYFLLHGHRDRTKSRIASNCDNDKTTSKSSSSIVIEGEMMHSFVASDLSHRICAETKWVLPRLNFKSIFVQTSSIFVDAPEYLRRLNWILNQSASAVALEDILFAQSVIGNLPDRQPTPNEPCFPETLTKTDVRNFLHSTRSQQSPIWSCFFVESCIDFVSVEEEHSLLNSSRFNGVLFPWILFTNSTPTEDFVWEAMLAVSKNKRLSLGQVVSLTHSLEKLREFGGKQEQNIASISTQEISKRPVEVEEIQDEETMIEPEISISVPQNSPSTIQNEEKIANDERLKEMEAQLADYERDAIRVRRLLHRFTKHNELLVKFWKSQSVVPQLPSTCEVLRAKPAMKSPPIAKPVMNVVPQTVATFTPKTRARNIPSGQPVETREFSVKMVTQTCPRQNPVNCRLKISKGNGGNLFEIFASDSWKITHKFEGLVGKSRYHVISKLTVRFLNLKPANEEPNQPFLPFFLTCTNHQHQMELIDCLNKQNFVRQDGY